MDGGFRFNFDSATASEPAAQAAPAEPAGAAAASLEGDWLYISSPALVSPPPVPVPIAGSRFVRAFADADDVAPGGRDIVRGIYEGGAKVWECTLDVEEWIAGDGAQEAAAARIALDLGCGAGVLGYAVLRASPSATVVLQDLNAEVIRRVTWPTVQLNGGGEALRRSVFLAADWARLDAAIRAGAEDVAWLRGSVNLVVSSETLYAVEAYPPLLSLLDCLLAPCGVALLGSKAFYFGVGGSVSAFVQAVNGSDGPLAAEVVKTFDDGKTVARALVRVHRMAPGESRSRRVS